MNITSVLGRFRVWLDGRPAIKRRVRRLVPDRVAWRIQVITTTAGIRTFHPRKVTHSYGSRLLTVTISDPVAEEWYDHDWEYPPEFQLLRESRLRPGATVFEVGAHQGIVAMMLGEVVGPEGLVVAVEANPHDAAVARDNIRENGISNVVVLHRAVGATTGTLDFSVTGRVHVGRGDKGAVSVESTTIDGLAATYGLPDVIYIDTEGYELEVLHGASQTLRSLPDCFVEVHAGRPLTRFGGSVPQVLREMPESSYTRWIANDETPFQQLHHVDPALLESRFFLVSMPRGPD